MSKAYLNALAEEGTRQDLINWLGKLDAENDELRDTLRTIAAQRSDIVGSTAEWMAALAAAALNK